MKLYVDVMRMPDRSWTAIGVDGAVLPGSTSTCSKHSGILCNRKGPAYGEDDVATYKIRAAAHTASMGKTGPPQ